MKHPHNAAFRAVVTQDRAGDAGPDRPLLITAVDATDGTFVVFDREASGGMRQAANTDLASGFDRIVILAPQARGGGPIWSLFVWVDVVDGSEGDHDQGESGAGGVEAVGPVDDEPHAP